MEMHRLGGAGMVAVARKEAFQRVGQLGGMLGGIVFDASEVLAPEGLQRFLVFALGNQEVDAELIKGHGAVATVGLGRDAGGLLSLTVGTNDGARTRRPAPNADGRRGSANQPAQADPRLLELSTDVVVRGGIVRWQQDRK